MKEGDIVSFIRQKDYILENSSLGEGSFGKTVLLKDPQLDDMLLVAKKYEPSRPTDKERFYKNFIDEIKILLTLNHPNIVRIYNWLLFPEKYIGFIVMEYIEGKNLEQYLKGFSPKYSPVTVNEVFVQLVYAFEYIEKKRVLHRDIKANHILITKDGQVKIIDFGVGKIIDKIAPSSVDTLAEKINRNSADIHPLEIESGEYTSQTDMFYLAEMFQRLLHATQREEFFTYSPILEKMKKRDSQYRYQSFSEIREAIEKKDFDTMSISPFDKNIYQNFANALFNAIVCYNDNPNFIVDTSLVLSKIDEILTNNLLEDEIQKVDDLISIFVLSSYRSNEESVIKVNIVREFRNWLSALDKKNQNIVVQNLVYKFGKKRIAQGYFDIPF